MRTPHFALALTLLVSACGDDAPGDTNDTADTVDTTDAADAVDTQPDDLVDPDTAGADTEGRDTSDAADANDASDASDTDVVDPGSDLDGDGLTYADELARGTDPTLADSDGDGFWDGWEVSAATDPRDPLSTPPLPELDGDPFVLDLIDIVEPSLLRSFLGSVLDRWPPILVFLATGPDTGDGTRALTLSGGIATRTSLGPDDTAGTADDAYALLFGALDPKDGDLRFDLAGTRSGPVVVAHADEISIDLSTVSELVRGVKLRVEDVTFEATFTDDGRLAPTRLTGILSRAGVEDILANASLPLPIDLETAMSILDPDGDGIIAVDLSLRGRPALSDGWSLAAPAEPAPRPTDTCCPATVSLNQPIDPALVVADQGLQLDEEALGAQVIAQALSHPDRLDFVATQRVIDGERRTYVFSPRGHIYFVRDRTIVNRAPATVFRTYLLASATDLEGTSIDQGDPRNPLADQDPTRLSDYASFLAAGEPFALTDDYATLGYTANDERLRRVPVGQNPYPFAYERLSQLFDDPRTGDLVLQPLAYAGSRGDHGHLSALQSRSPLILSGAGIRRPTLPLEDDAGFSLACAGPCTDATPAESRFVLRDAAARIVDVAPTVAKALGVATTRGVGPDGFLVDGLYLAWQDGRPLDAVLSGTTARYAIIVVNDGLTSMELLHQTLGDDADLAPLDAYRELMSRGVTFRHGAITNFPSNTYPSHNDVGCGAWSGHHGLVDNGFYERQVATVFRPIVELFGTEKFIASAHPSLPIETLHEAVARSFGGIWNKASNASGVLTASLNDPSTHGAGLATLERRLPEGYTVPGSRDALTLAGGTFPYPTAGLTDAEGLLDNSTVTAAWGLYVDNPKRGVPIPRYAVINFASTDGAGHHAGPHGDEVRKRVLAATNARLRLLIRVLKEAGIYDETLIVLTADHGMELKDPSVRSDVLAGLPADIGLVREHAFVYLKQLLASHGDLAGASTTFIVTDRDNGLPIAGALVVVRGAEAELARGVTDAHGVASLSGPLSSATTLTLSKTGFSTETRALTP
jgi:hypothetical protein